MHLREDCVIVLGEHWGFFCDIYLCVHCSIWIDKTLFFLQTSHSISFLLRISILLLFLGYKIFRTKIDFEHFEDKSQLNEKIKKKEKGGFYTGCIINFLNPTLFIGWLTSTFLVISFVSSLGFNTGGLDIFIDQSVKEISSFESSVTDSYNYYFACQHETS